MTHFYAWHEKWVIWRQFLLYSHFCCIFNQGTLNVREGTVQLTSVHWFSSAAFDIENITVLTKTMYPIEEVDCTRGLPYQLAFLALTVHLISSCKQFSSRHNQIFFRPFWPNLLKLFIWRTTLTKPNGSFTLAKFVCAKPSATATLYHKDYSLLWSICIRHKKEIILSGSRYPRWPMQVQ
jgi:hypothetical protein